jgi:hypothetical protein
MVDTCMRTLLRATFAIGGKDGLGVTRVATLPRLRSLALAKLAVNSLACAATAQPCAAWRSSSAAIALRVARIPHSGAQAAR